MERIKAEKDQELEILQHGMDDAIRKLGELQVNQGVTDEAVNAQIDTLILDQQKKLNQIIDSIFQASVAKVDDAIYELESPVQQGNQTATPEYTLSMIEKCSTGATEFASVFSAYLGGEKGGEHVEVIKTLTNLSQSIADVLSNTKGVSRLARTDEDVDKIVQKGKSPGDTAIRAFLALQSYRLEGMPLGSKRDALMKHTIDLRASLQGLATSVEALVPKDSSSLSRATGEIGDHVEREMLAASKAIEAATQRLQALMSRPKDTGRYSTIDLQVHDAILGAAMAITNAIAKLIAAATASQQEIVARGRGTSSVAAFYKKNSRWTEGLLSAAKAVAWATTLLIETADGVVSGNKPLEQLIAASNEVAGATAQLVQASRVKADFMSKTQETLELAAKAVTEACKALVRQVKAVTEKQSVNGDAVDYSNLGSHDFKMREFEAQVQILTFEKELTNARRALAELRRHGYHEEGESFFLMIW